MAHDVFISSQTSATYQPVTDNEANDLNKMARLHTAVVDTSDNAASSIITSQEDSNNTQVYDCNKTHCIMTDGGPMYCHCPNLYKDIHCVDPQQFNLCASTVTPCTAVQAIGRASVLEQTIQERLNQPAVSLLTPLHCVRCSGTEPELLTDNTSRAVINRNSGKKRDVACEKPRSKDHKTNRKDGIFSEHWKGRGSSFIASGHTHVWTALKFTTDWLKSFSPRSALTESSHTNTADKGMVRRDDKLSTCASSSSECISSRSGRHQRSQSMWYNSKIFFLGLLLCLVQMANGYCGDTPFKDPASSGLLADLVIEGRIRSTSQPDAEGTFSVEVSVRKRVLKGVELLKRTRSGKQAKRVTIRKFRDGEEDHEKCIGSVRKGATYMFFLKDTGDKKGLHYSLSAMPIKKSKKLVRAVRRFLCRKCAKAPTIRKVTGPGGVRSGVKTRLKCIAKAKPDPVFAWYKDGVLLKHGQGRIKIKSGRRSSRLQIRRASNKDTGTYECVVSNAIGEDRRAFKLKVTDEQLMADSLTKKEPGEKVSSSSRKIRCKEPGFCLNGAECFIREEVNYRYCQCPPNFTGKRCQQSYLPDAATTPLSDVAGRGLRPKGRGGQRGGRRKLLGM